MSHAPSPTPAASAGRPTTPRALPRKGVQGRAPSRPAAAHPSFRAFLEGLGERQLQLADPKGPLPTLRATTPGATTPGATSPYLGPETERERPRPTSPRLAESEDLERFVLPSPALLPPIVSSTPVAPPVGSALASAEAAALAERVLTSLRVGRVAGMPEVRMRLGGRGIEVRLRLDEGRVVPVLVSDRPEEARAMAERLDELFAERGIDADPVVVERG